MRNFLFLLMLFVCSSAFARQIAIPSTAKHGELSTISGKKAVIESNTYTMAPGLKIHNAQNALIFVQQLKSSRTVAFRLDASKELIEIWELSDKEIAALNGNTSTSTTE